MNKLLGDNFLQDLADLEDENEDQYQQNNQNSSIGQKYESQINDLKEQFKQKDEQISRLITDEEFLEHMRKIRLIADKPQEFKNQISVQDNQNDEYNLITKCNEFANIIDREVQNVHKFIKDIYQAKFPELESLVLNPIEYAKCILEIQNKTDLNKVDLSQILTSHQIVAVTVAGSSTSGKPLKQQQLQQAMEGSNIILQLDDMKKEILNFVEKRMQYIAPNLSKLVGSNIAAQLMALAGGLNALANMPACNIQVLGNQRKNNLGLAKGTKHYGIFGTMDMVKNAPNVFQTKLVRMLSTNTALCARIDLSKSTPNGSKGEEFKQNMLKRFDKIQEPPPAKKIKPLVLADDKPKRRRGGKRFRNMQEKLRITEIRKYQNQMKFGPDQEQEFQGSGKGFGMLGVANKVKIEKKQTKLQISKANQERLNQMRLQASGATEGLKSNINFTPLQAMQLINPETLNKQQKGPDQYFNQESGFKTVIEERRKGIITSILNGGHQKLI